MEKSVDINTFLHMLWIIYILWGKRLCNSAFPSPYLHYVFVCLVSVSPVMQSHSQRGVIHIYISTYLHIYVSSHNLAHPVNPPSEATTKWYFHLWPELDMHTTGCCKTSVKLCKPFCDTFLGVILLFLCSFDCQIWAIFHFGTLWLWKLTYFLKI